MYMYSYMYLFTYIHVFPCGEISPYRRIVRLPVYASYFGMLERPSYAGPVLLVCLGSHKVSVTWRREKVEEGEHNEGDEVKVEVVKVRFKKFLEFPRIFKMPHFSFPL